MTIAQSLEEVLDETVDALSHLDLERLNALEQRAVLLAGSNANFETSSLGLVRPKKRRLEIVLQNCRTNLNALTRLHERNVRNQWAQ
jgi:hypothetical protein